MTKKMIIILGISLGIGKVASAQSDVNDLVRYSGIQYQGTARSTGAGNAFGAVGADFGAIGINPAGLGLYQRSEFSGTLGFEETSASGTYLGNSTTSTSSPNFNVGNIGIVIANNKKQKGKDVSSGWLNVNWGIGFTRTNNFNSSTVIEGNNTNNSILASWKENANAQGVGPYQLYNHNGPQYGTYGQLAFSTFMLDPAYYVNPYADSTKYVDATRFDSKINVYQRDVIQTTGATNNISISVAGNYLGKLYLGATINVPTISFNSTRTFYEYNNNPRNGNDSQYVSSRLSESLNTTGIGVNATLGAIYRFNDMFRLGLSVQLPTVYSLTDIFGTAINGNTIAQGPVTDSASNPSGFQYTIVTPARVTLSGALFFSQNGFLSADYEYVDYATARVNGNSYVDLNQTVQNQLQGVNTLRIGAEYRIQSFMIRAGYNYISSPYKSGLQDDGFTDTYNILSFGVGFRAKNMGLDLTYQLVTNKSTYTPYNLTDPADIAQYGNSPSADVTTTKGNVMLTFTTRF